ncbi:MAG: T9SS type A sorting domain-containing protein [Bacteroidales bacterium]|nr:T9SS type A sorting domain-containing protein [Bacteroidales bacterium]
MKTLFIVLLAFLSIPNPTQAQLIDASCTPIVSQAGYSDTSKTLTSIRTISPSVAQGHHQYKKILFHEHIQNKTFKNCDNALGHGSDPAVHKESGQKDVTIPVRTFEGNKNPINGSSYLQDWVYPPDANGDIGPNHYVQMCNTIFEIFNREGNSLFGPADSSPIWDGLDGNWTGTNDGYPTNQMTWGDMEISLGSASQAGTHRWGDYSSMKIDPADQQTFWFTSQLVKNTSNAASWGTSIAAIGLRNYCTATGGCDEYISNVVRGIQNNISGCSGYADYTNLSSNLPLNMSLNVTVHNGHPYDPDQCGIWVDWNRDGDFTDTGETIAVSGNPGLGPYTAILQAPAGTTTGPCIMRTRIIYTGILDPCGTTQYGEVEDYTINVTSAAANTWIGSVSQYWNNPANWSLGHVPVYTEDAIITTTGQHPVIFNLISGDCKNLIIQNNAGLIFYDNDLTVHGDLQVFGQITFNSDYSTIIAYNDVFWEAGSSATINGHGQFYVYADWYFNSGATVDLSGSCTSFFATYYPSTIYNFSDNCFFGDLNSSKPYDKDLTIDQSSNDIIITGDLQVGYNSSLSMESSNDLVVRGDLTNEGAFYLPNGTLVMQGIDQLITTQNGQVFQNLTIQSEGTVSFSDNGLNTFSIGGYLSINSGVLDISEKTVEIYLGWLNTVGPDALIEDNSKVIFKGFGYKNCSAEEFDNFEINSASGAGVEIMENNFVSCNSYKHTFGGGIYTSGSGGGFTAYDLADPGIYGHFAAYNGAIINLYQDDASYIDLNGSLVIEGGEIYVHGGLGDCYWPYQGNGSLFMTEGILDFMDAGIYLYNSPSFTLSTAIYGGTIRTAGNFLGYRDDFNPTGGTVELYGNADVYCSLNAGSNFYDLNINKFANKELNKSHQKKLMEYRDGKKKPIEKNNQITMEGDLWSTGDFIVNVDNFQPQNLTLGLSGPGDADVLIAGNNCVQDLVVSKFPPTESFSTRPDAGLKENNPGKPSSGKTELNGIVTAIGNVNVTHDLTIDNGSFDVSQYVVSVANDVNINYGTLIMNHTNSRLECHVINWFEESMDDITEGEIHCYDWHFYEGTLAQLGPGNTAFVSGLPLQFEENASFGNLELGNSGSSIILDDSRGQRLVTSGYFRQQAGTYIFAMPIHVGTDFIIEEPATFHLTNLGDILVEYSLILNGLLENNNAFIQVHGNFDFPAGGQLVNNGTILFDRPLGSYFELYGNLTMSEPDAVLSFLHHGIDFKPTFTENITDGTIRVGSTVVASNVGTFTPQGGILELLYHFEPGFPDSPYLFFSSGNFIHNLLVNAQTTDYMFQTDVKIKGDLTINSGQLWAHLGNIDIEGNWTNNLQNSFHHGYRLVSFTGTGPSTITTDENFYNVTMNKTGAATEDVVIGSGKTVQIENNLHITAGTMEINSSALLDIGHNLTLSNGAGLNAGGEDVNVIVKIGGNWTDNNTSATSTKGFFAGTSSVVFDGTVDQEVISGGTSETFYNLEIDKPSGNFTPSTNLNVLQDLLVSNGLFYNVADRSHQLYRNLSIQPGGQFLPYGTFTFAGGEAAIFQDSGLATSFFENVIVNKESELTLLNAMTLMNGGDIIIQQGTMYFNGTTLAVSGDVGVEDGGKLAMDAGSVLKTGSGQVLDIASGGLLESIGSTGEPCVISHFDGGFYEFNINEGGSISTENTIFEYAGQRYGVNILPGAFVDPVHSFHGCTFRNGDPGVQDAALISFENDQDITVNNAVFVSANTPFNASKENEQGHVTFVNATGDLAGEAYENDPSGLIDWIGGNTTQSIMLPQGWSGLSAYVLPDPTDIEMIFSPVVSELILLQNNAGMYYPAQSINTIGSWPSQAAFKAKMLNETLLEIPGSFEPDQSFQISQGWNIVPIIANAPVDAETLFASVNLTVAKEVAGFGILWPEYGINTLGDLFPGKAYYALAASAGTIDFPAYAKSDFRPIDVKNDMPKSPWNEISVGASSHLIAFTGSAIENLLKGDIVGIFSQNGICFGVMEISPDNPNSVLVAFADDPLTSADDGFVSGDPFRFQLFRSETNENFDLEPIYDQSLPNTGSFQNEGLSSIIQLKLSSTGMSVNFFSEILIYPNPGTGGFWVEGIHEFSTIEVSNALGEHLVILPVKSQNRVRLDLSDFEAGIYQLKLFGKKGMIVKKVVKR